LQKKKVTLKEIAERTGVSLGTVHRAIYGKSGVSEETRARIMEEVVRTNYQIDEAASVLKRRAKKVVVVLPKAHKEDRFYFRGIWKGIQDAAQNMDQYKIYYDFVESDYPLSQIWRELERVYDEKLDEIDGLITMADSEKANIWIGRFAKRGVFTVLLSSYYDEKSSMVSCIKADHARCGILAAEFMDYGIRKEKGKILTFCGDEHIYSNRVYASNFEEKMKEYGYDLIKVEGFGSDEIEKKSREILQRENIQGIFMCNARNTYCICKLVDELNIDRDFLILGTDVYEELIPYFEKGILNAVICQFHWDQGTQAVLKMHKYLSRGIQEQEDHVMPPVLLMKSNVECFL